MFPYQRIKALALSSSTRLNFSQQQPTLILQGYQCQVVDYSNPSSLQHALMGVDTVISTVTGSAQLRLIEASIHCQVRRFAPAEFEGQPSLRRQNDILDRGRSAALQLLQQYRGYIQFTVFVCGILFERLSINGMVSHRIGVNTGYGHEGDYIAHVRNMTSVAPVWNDAQNLACLCLTSAYDVARFVVRSLDMPMWAPEMSMCGERMTVNTLVEIIRSCRSMTLNHRKELLTKIGSDRPWAQIEYLDPASKYSTTRFLHYQYFLISHSRPSSAAHHRTRKRGRRYAMATSTSSRDCRRSLRLRCTRIFEYRIPRYRADFFQRMVLGQLGFAALTKRISFRRILKRYGKIDRHPFLKEARSWQTNHGMHQEPYTYACLSDINPT